MSIAEGDAVLLRGQRGQVLDEGDVRAVSQDGRRALVRWRGPGGLRAVQWVDLDKQDVRRVAPRAEEVRRGDD